MSQKPKPIQTDTWEYEDRGVKITTFLVCLINQYELLAETGETIFHWRASGTYRDAEGAPRSTIFDTYKDSVADRVINIQFRSKEYWKSRRVDHRLKAWERPVKNDLTTQQVYDIIEKRGLTKFENNPAGMGCRTWVRCLVETLQIEGYLEEDSVREFDRFVAETQRVYGSRVANELGAGLFDQRHD